MCYFSWKPEFNKKSSFRLNRPYREKPSYPKQWGIIQLVYFQSLTQWCPQWYALSQNGPCEWGLGLLVDKWRERYFIFFWYNVLFIYEVWNYYSYFSTGKTSLLSQSRPTKGSSYANLRELDPDPWSNCSWKCFLLMIK